MKKTKLAIVGATGLVGRTAIKVLEEKKFPNFEYSFFSSKKSAGSTLKLLDKNYIVKELKEDSFDEGFDYAIFSAGTETAKKYAPIAVKKRCIVIDNSSAFRMNSEVPLVVPEVNPEDILNNNGIIANPNCSTIQAVVPLKILDDNYRIKRIVYSTYQAVSGAGKLGIEDLLYKNSGDKLKKFAYPIYNNCLPQIDIFLDDGYTKEEHKMINETKKILHNNNLKITATAVRVPVENCHCEAINVEFENDFNLNDIFTLFENNKNIILMDNINKEIYPIPTKVSGNDQVFVGRIRRDFSNKNTLNFWAVADNIRKGAASNAIQILELLTEI